MCVALVIGNTIGSGIFLLPASLAQYGNNSLIGWVFSASGAVLLAVVFARLSRAFPYAGGPHAYVSLAFGPFAAYVVAWGYWVSIWVGNVSIATGAISYLTPLIPSIATVPGISALITLAAVWLLTFVNWYGVKASGWVTSVTTVLKLMPLVVVIGLGLFARSAASVTSLISPPMTLSGITAAATLCMWALLGFESATIPADKVHDPGRTIPAATMLGTILTALICAAACTTVLLRVPTAVLLKSNAPFVDAISGTWGAGAGRVLAVFAAISGFGALNGWIWLQAEMPNVMARRGVFPPLFAHESRRGTPDFALFFGSALVSVLVLMNYQASMVEIFTFMILLSTVGALVLYGACSLALLRLQWQGKLNGARRGTVPLAVVGVLGAAYSLWAIIGAGWSTAAWGALLLAAGVPIYVFMRHRATAQAPLQP